MLHISAGLFAALDDYVQAVTHAAHTAHAEGVDTLVRSLRESAEADDRWKDVSDDIEAWHDGDVTYFGVRHPRSVDQAVKAEFGDRHNPPSPLLRNHPVAVHKASERMDSVLRSHLGIPR